MEMIDFTAVFRPITVWLRHAEVALINPRYIDPDGQGSILQENLGDALDTVKRLISSVILTCRKDKEGEEDRLSHKELFSEPTKAVLGELFAWEDRIQKVTDAVREINNYPGHVTMPAPAEHVTSESPCLSADAPNNGEEASDSSETESVNDPEDESVETPPETPRANKLSIPCFPTTPYGGRPRYNLSLKELLQLRRKGYSLQKISKVSNISYRTVKRFHAEVRFLTVLCSNML
jgi:hypothetical protein